jgi:hypothetical protein
MSLTAKVHRAAKIDVMVMSYQHGLQTLGRITMWSKLDRPAGG